MVVGLVEDVESYQTAPSWFFIHRRSPLAAAVKPELQTSIAHKEPAAGSTTLFRRRGNWRARRQSTTRNLAAVQNLSIARKRAGVRRWRAVATECAPPRPITTFVGQPGSKIFASLLGSTLKRGKPVFVRPQYLLTSVVPQPRGCRRGQRDERQRRKARPSTKQESPHRNTRTGESGRAPARLRRAPPDRVSASGSSKHRLRRLRRNARIVKGKEKEGKAGSLNQLRVQVEMQTYFYHGGLYITAACRSRCDLCWNFAMDPQGCAVVRWTATCRKYNERLHVHASVGKTVTKTGRSFFTQPCSSPTWWRAKSGRSHTCCGGILAG